VQREAVDMGCLEIGTAIAGNICITEVVSQDEDYVRRTMGRFRKQFVRFGGQYSHTDSGTA
jgi:hypothetical protein